MNSLPLFTALKFPDTCNPPLIKDFLYIEVNDDVRIWYKLNSVNTGTTDERFGFNFYITNFICVNADEIRNNEPYYDCSSLEVECLFYGHVLWDGLRHLYMGDKQTDTENYLYYIRPQLIAEVFTKLHELEKQHCSLDQLGL